MSTPAPPPPRPLTWSFLYGPVCPADCLPPPPLPPLSPSALQVLNGRAHFCKEEIEHCDEVINIVFVFVFLKWIPECLCPSVRFKKIKITIGNEFACCVLIGLQVDGIQHHGHVYIEAPLALGSYANVNEYK